MRNIKNYCITIIMMLCFFVTEASANEPFTRYVGGLISDSRNVETCQYNETHNWLEYRTYSGEERTVSCWWHPEVEDGRITITPDTLEQLKQTDYVMIGYAQSANNPQYFYFIPSNEIKENMDLRTMNKYLLSHPIVNNRF